MEAEGKTTPTVKNYLGHPCNLAPALDRYAEAIEQSRKEHDDPRWLAQRLGRDLVSLADRVEHAHDVAELARDLADELADGDRLHSLLAMHADFALKTASDAYDLAGMLLDLMQRADMVKPSQQVKAAHG